MGLAIIILAAIVLVVSLVFAIYKGFSMGRQEATDMLIMQGPRTYTAPIGSTPEFLPVGKHLLNISSSFPSVKSAKHNQPIETQAKTLLNESVCLALRLLTKHRENIPFSVLMHSTGEFQYLACDDSNNPTEISAEDLYQSVVMASQECISEGTIKAIALVHHGYLAKSHGESDIPAIVVYLEYQGGSPKRLVIPYVRKADDLVFAYSATVENTKRNFLNDAIE